ncbi:MAG TPA: cupin domain-containing protein [Acidimicrobiia bacterium]|nr:cupin domain-containing protein [Acidimicrobiia bacterium]
MEHTPVGAFTWERGSAETFTGVVWSSPLSRAPDRTVTAIGVMFEPGARSFWHSHPDGQLLYVANGAGRVGSADGRVTDIAAGDVIYTPAGETHWHGAAPHTYLMHVSITTGGATAWEPRAVTDEEYNAGS